MKGKRDAETNFVTNLSDISALVRERVISKLDHKNVNLDVDFMKGKLATTETLAVEIWKQLSDGMKKFGCDLHCVKIQETENNYVEYFGN